MHYDEESTLFRSSLDLNNPFQSYHISKEDIFMDRKVLVN